MSGRKKAKPVPTAVEVLRIEGELSIFRAAELKPVLLPPAALTEIDLSGVTEIDTAGLQLLLLARRAAQAQGQALRLVATSPTVDELFTLLNVAACFAPGQDKTTGACHES